jgi:MFS family permease
VLLGMMTALNVLNFVDRQLICSLAPLLIADPGSAGRRSGCWSASLFVMLYTLVGMVLGLAADRWPRRASSAGASGCAS